MPAFLVISLWLLFVAVFTWFIYRFVTDGGKLLTKREKAIFFSFHLFVFMLGTVLIVYPELPGLSDAVSWIFQWA
ncbi:hypothetical protein G4V62_07580 [Bacillaceae bacterium SIJ1]|uniref:hypothetical protein n=1 Tax=Litoribacterium kuwaitense TaxID=1398745 RepID=UPI0013EACDD3|nr:hypothetical protein [Litoribacterium kuwaitense]NGP44825.1 hypothetical protein [Litoribacterium kuwaitense]